MRKARRVGLAQSLALMPGVSRSGITISAGRFLGLDRDSAARFSFLLLLPITFGAVSLQGRHRRPPLGSPARAVGRSSSACSPRSRAARRDLGLLGYVRRHDYSIFVIYRLVVAAFVLLLIATGVRSATF